MCRKRTIWKRKKFYFRYINKNIYFVERNIYNMLLRGDIMTYIIGHLILDMKRDNGAFMNFLVKQQILSFDIIEDALLELKNGELLCNYTKFISGVDVDRLIKKIIALKDANFMIEVAKKFEMYVNVLALEVIKTRDAKNICNFAKYVSKAPVDKLADAIVETGDGEYIYYFASYVCDSPLEKLLEALLWIDKNYYIKFILYAQNISDDLYNILINKLKTLRDYQALVEIIMFVKVNNQVNSNLSKYMFKHMEELLNFIKQCNNKEFVISFMKQLNGTRKETEKEIMDNLIALYQKGDYETIRKNRDYFASLFQEKEVKIERK